MAWKVLLAGKAIKQAKKLSGPAADAFKLLWRELIEDGPVQASWPNFSKLRGSRNEWHCHLKRGRPTYVACWRSSKYKKLESGIVYEGEIEIYYVGTHENAPY